jgi:hypothetical protein
MERFMGKKRTDTLSDLRRQRQRLRRIGIAALLAGGLFALVSCEELTHRQAAPTSSTISPIMLPGSTAARRS